VGLRAGLNSVTKSLASTGNQSPVIQSVT